jgi:hypothetical protein
MKDYGNLTFITEKSMNHLFTDATVSVIWSVKWKTCMKHYPDRSRLHPFIQRNYPNMNECKQNHHVRVKTGHCDSTSFVNEGLRHSSIYYREVNKSLFHRCYSFSDSVCQMKDLYEALPRQKLVASFHQALINPNINECKQNYHVREKTGHCDSTSFVNELWATKINVD